MDETDLFHDEVDSNLRMRYPMKTLRMLGTFIVIHIVVRVLLVTFLPNTGTGFEILIDIVFIGAFLLTIVSLLLGSNHYVLKNVLRTIWLVIGLSVLTIIISFATGHHGEDILSTLIKEVLPFGKIMGSLFWVVRDSAFYERPMNLSIDFARDVAKLLLQTALNPIFTGFASILMFSERMSDESCEKSSKQSYFHFVNPEPAYNRLNRRFSLRGALTSSFGAVYAAYAATFVFNGLVKVLSVTFGISKTFIMLFLCIISVGLVLLIWLSPILRADKRPTTGLSISQSAPQGKNILMKLLFSLVKMFILNIIIIIILGLFSGTVS